MGGSVRQVVAESGAPRVREVAAPAFVPPWWCSSMHPQTVTAAFKPAGGPRGEPVRIPLESGGTLGARWHRGPRRTNAIVVYVHGIGGSADEGFCVRGAWGAVARGLDALRVSMRGCGDSLDTEYAALVHNALATDVRAMVDWALERYERVHLVGFSLGGHNVLRAAVEWGDRVPAGVTSVVSVSAPVDMPESGDFADGPTGWPYRRPFLRDLVKRHLAALARGAPGPQGIRLDRIRTVRDWDAKVIAPWLGFDSVESYRRTTSVAPHLHEIRVPTLVVHADDDPIACGASNRRLARETFPSVRFLSSPRGGHCGFLGARPAPGDATRWWADERALAWIAAHDPDASLVPLPVPALPAASAVGRAA